MKKKKSLKLSIAMVFTLSLGFTGCVGLVPAAVSLAPSIIDGVIEHQRDQYKDIKITLARGYTIEDMKKIESVSFLVSGSKNNYFDSGIGEVFGDNLTREFMAEGYEVIDRASIENIVEEQKFQMSSFSNNKNLAKIGTILGINGIFKGSVQSGQGINRGFMGIGANIKNGIVSASLKLVDVKTGKTMMIISTSYEKPKNPSEVALHMAKSFKLYQENKEKIAQK